MHPFLTLGGAPLSAHVDAKDQQKECHHQASAHCPAHQTLQDDREAQQATGGVAGVVGSRLGSLNCCVTCESVNCRCDGDVSIWMVGHAGHSPIAS